MQVAAASRESSPPASPKGSSDIATDSIRQMVRRRVRTIQECLEAICSRGVVDVFAMTGRNRAVFPQAYQEYSSQITTLEESICSYLVVRR